MAVVNFFKYGNIRNLHYHFGRNRMFTHWMYIDHPYPKKGLSGSVLANPWSSDQKSMRIRVSSEKIAIANYKRWLWRHINLGNREVINELKRIDKNTALVCLGNPEHSHGHVVEAAARWLQTDEGKKLLKGFGL